MGVRAIRELCDELLGPLELAGDGDDAADGSGWSPRVLGLSKRSLLAEVVLPALATNRALQRVLAEYLENLGAVQGGGAEKS